MESFRTPVLAWHQQGVEGKAIWHLPMEQHGFAGSHTALKRFLRSLAAATPVAIVWVETPLGAEGQVNFGAAGQILDPATGRLGRAGRGCPSGERAR